MAKIGLSVEKALKGAQKKRETWSQTTRQGDDSEEIRVEKLDNKGYIVTIRQNWYDSKGNWKEKEKKLYSDTNPLDPDESDNPVDKLFKIISGDKK